ncbi:hypothetical protein N7G274_010113 [Stereocaulon virgatum]|uniref:Uncharacterized protein n=1 Tax=Stereocaulon virgatum TaxID=373712 RepID=A0ABR3ZU66_9LECA
MEAFGCPAKCARFAPWLYSRIESRVLGARHGPLIKKVSLWLAYYISPTSPRLQVRLLYSTRPSQHSSPSLTNITLSRFHPGGGSKRRHQLLRSPPPHDDRLSARVYLIA